MVVAKTKTKMKQFVGAKITVRPKEFQRFFIVASEMNEILEDMLEIPERYGKTFLKELKKSLKEAREGKLIPIKSTRDLC